MSKMKIPWHEECYNNNLIYLTQKQVELKRLEEECEKMALKLAGYFTQIETAKQRGMDGFDRERFLRHRAKST
jgi:hypothetical protein